MHSLVAVAIRVLEFLFFAGMIGSALVVLLTGIEDVRTLFGGNDKEQP